jgi:hypothetical protein
VKLQTAFDLRLAMRHNEEEDFAPIRRVQLKPYATNQQKSFDEYIQTVKIEMNQLRKEKNESDEKLRKALEIIENFKSNNEMEPNNNEQQRIAGNENIEESVQKNSKKVTRLFKCEIDNCPNYFKTKTELKKHLKVHSGKTL